MNDEKKDTLPQDRVSEGCPGIGSLPWRGRIGQDLAPRANRDGTHQQNGTIPRVIRTENNHSDENPNSNNLRH